MAKQQCFLLAADADSILLDDLRELIEQAQRARPTDNRRPYNPLRSCCLVMWMLATPELMLAPSKRSVS